MITNNTNKVTTVLLTTVLIAITGISLIGSKQNNEKSGRFISVEGNVEREVTADSADWTLCFEHIGPDQQTLENRISQEKDIVNKLLLERGFLQQEIEIYNYVKQDYYRRNNNSDENEVRYRVGYFVHVKTKKMELVTNFKNNISKIIGPNMGLNKNSLRVSCSNQSEINREVTRLAAAAALKNATDLSEFLKVKLGKIISIDNPRIYTESSYPEVDGGLFRVNMVKSAGIESSAAENNASENMTKQKIKASINMTIAIK